MVFPGSVVKRIECVENIMDADFARNRHPQLLLFGL